MKSCDWCIVIVIEGAIYVLADKVIITVPP